MTSAKDAILGKIRNSLGRGELSPAQQQTLEARVCGSPDTIRPAFTTPLLTRFVSQLEGVAGSFEQVRDRAEAVRALLAYVEGKGLAGELVAAPSLQDWPWTQDLQIRFGGTQGDDLISVTGCFAAIAETGSVVLLSGAESPTGLNFLPDDHVVFVEADQLLRHMEDVWPLLRALPEAPRTVNLISGPSKTADVEQTLQIGAHGPRRFHVVFIGDAPS